MRDALPDVEKVSVPVTYVYGADFALYEDGTPLYDVDGSLCLKIL